MKFRVTLALLFLVGIGTSVYCTEKATPLTNQLGVACCDGHPDIPTPPIPIPLPTPAK